MEEQCTFKIRYLVATLLAFGIALTFYYGQSFKEAVYLEGFPVPAKAKILQVSTTEQMESYSWQPASEKSGLPMRYQLIIQFSGWKKSDQTGTLTTYEKDGIKVAVISQTHTLALLGQQN